MRTAPIVVLAACLVVGCAAPPEQSGVDIVDDLERRVRIPANPLRLISLAPNVTELVHAAGAGDRLVAVTVTDSVPDAVLSLPRVQSLPVDLEAVVTHRPDLVLASEQVNDPRDADRLEGLGIPTIFVSIQSLEDVFEAISRIGRIVGTDEWAARVADSLRGRLASLPVREPEGPGVLVLVGDETLWSFGSGSYVHDMVARAGGRSVTADLALRAPVLSDEFVIQAAPDIIVIAARPGYDPGRIVTFHPALGGVPAVRNGRVYPIHPDLVLRPGPRLVDGVEALAGLIGGGGEVHP